MPRITASLTAGGNLDVAVSSRAAIADWTAARALLVDRLSIITGGGAGELTAARMTNLDRLDVASSTLAPAATALSTATWTAGKAGFLDLAVSGRAARPSASAGHITQFASQAAATVLTDSGALAVGDWEFIIWGYIQAAGGAGGWLDIEHRNAGNAANIANWQRVYLATQLGMFGPYIIRARTMAANERVRTIVQNAAAPAQGVIYQEERQVNI